MQPILKPLFAAEDLRRICRSVRAGEGPCAVFGVPEIQKSHIAAVLAEESTVLLVTSTDTGAVRMAADIRALGVPCGLFLPRDIPLTHILNISNERSAERIAALTRLADGCPGVTVASMQAVLQRLAPKAEFVRQRFTVSTGDDIEPQTLIRNLSEAGYERVDAVEGRGQMALRGGIVDAFPVNAPHPVRIEFWGDTVDQMRSFDPMTQRSIDQLLRVEFSPAYETPQTHEAIRRALPRIRGKEEFASQYEAWSEGRPAQGADALLPLLYPRLQSVVDWLPANGVLLADEPYRLEESAKSAQLEFNESVSAMLEREEGLPEQGELQTDADEALASLAGGRTLVLYTLPRQHPVFSAHDMMESSATPAPQYMGSIEELGRDIGMWRRNKESVLLFAGDRAETLRENLVGIGCDIAIAENISGIPEPGEVLLAGTAMPRGIHYPAQHITVLGEQELFGRDMPAPKPKKRGVPRIDELAVGDFIVHETHGIGRFVGIETLTVQGNTHDYLLIEYRGGDRLYIPTDQLDRICKYIGAEDGEPSLSKLGGNEWQNRVAKAKASAKKLAVDLAALYADRLTGKGYAFSPDTAWQKQMEEAFPYRETPDQLASIREIKADMERPRPMDRLLCGDVGYGKTEVALRAAFKAVQDSKQVAFLVPTTILAQQHYNTAAARFADFPVRIACLSRFTQPAERKILRDKIQNGQIDIIIGTHALLAKDVRFKDLGLLIVDEEQRFGVNHKEKIKELKTNVDVLTLTATPIPRTLNMSMTGVRDISVMETPPESRYPVQTYVLEYTDALIIDAVTREKARGGQTYIVYNRVASMEGFVSKLSALMPDVTFLMAHGQMQEAQLEKTMLSFLEHEADVLVCSTIIESGLDIPNVNTLIVIEADRFGLSQLYQLRGRVGRSTRLGYAYLTIRRGTEMNEQARKRLMAIREYTQFGAGFKLAMRDLEIRGAGSLLGAEQHGHIADIGYDYYCKLMRNALSEVRGEDLSGEEREVTVDIAVSAYIPREYIPIEVQRLSAYRRIADARSEEELADAREELEDRYGDVPEPVQDMLAIAAIRCRAAKAQLVSVTVKDGEAVLAFGPDTLIDGAKLLFAVSGVRGAQLTATEPPAIRIVRKDVGARSFMRELPQFLTTVASCSDTIEPL